MERGARIIGNALMLAGGILTAMSVMEALDQCPGVRCEDVTLSTALYAAMFSLGGVIRFWAKRG